MRLDDVDGRDKPGHEDGAADAALPALAKGTVGFQGTARAVELAMTVATRGKTA